MGGYPDLRRGAAHARMIARHADIIELGVPFSDPLADGPTIQAAGQAALAGGTRPDDVIAIAEQIAGGPPVVLMTYVNAILAAGPRGFFGRAAAAGVAGVIVPDLPIDEAAEVRAAAGRSGVAVIALAAPTTSDARLAEIGRRAEGFVYCVSVTGVTGGEVQVDEELRRFLERARERIAVPLAVGFGIRSPEHARRIGEFADGVVVASQLIRLIADETDPDAGDAAMDALAGEIAGALRGMAPAR